jgi:hypothetical protein
VTDAEQRAMIEKMIGRELTLAERNIDIPGLNRDLNDAKARLAGAVERAKMKAVRAWLATGMVGLIVVQVTPEIRDLLAEMYDAGWRHAQEELRKGGYAAFTDRRRRRREAVKRLSQQLATLFGTINFRVNEEAAATLDLGIVAADALAEELAKVPGALDVASRMTSPGVYAGLGDAFDVAADTVDVDAGGRGWEYTSVMDKGTCEPCAGAHGRTYPSWAAAQIDLPNGGPNPRCFGGTRCRCRLAPVPL